MPWQYDSTTGQLSLNGKVVATGYSGAGAGRNNPAMENVPNVGPIPAGDYTIGSPYDTRTHGPHVMRLTPQGHDARGRSGFLIHGDNRTHTASQGCIILDRATRDQISNSHDSALQVVRWNATIGLGIGIALALAVGACSPGQSATKPQVAPSHQMSTSQASAAVAPDDPVVVRLARDVAKDGPKRYLARVSDEDADWRRLQDRMAAGDPAALSLAERLRPDADAGAAEALDASAAQGLPRAPLAVLRLTGAGASVESLCTSPFIEPEPGVEKRYNQEALAALDRVPAAQRSQPMFDRCRSALAKIKAELQR